MSTLSEILDCFKVFDVPVSATIHELDNKYSFLSMKAQKQKNDDPDLCRQEQIRLDEAYYVLLQHYIQKDCEQRQQRRQEDLEYANFLTRAFKRGADRRLSKNKTRARSVRRQRLLDEMMQDGSEDYDIDMELSYLDQEQKEDNFGGAGDENRDDDDDDDESIIVPGSRRKVQSAVEEEHQDHCDQIFDIIEQPEDIFEAPDNAIIVHSVNCLGVWGSGFAKVLKWRFPGAFGVYSRHCQTVQQPSSMLGYCLLIPPQPADYSASGKREPRRWIACLFTSTGFGKKSASAGRPGRDDVDKIVMNTDSALVDLRNQLDRLMDNERDRRPGAIYSPRINAGRFGVPWERTKWLIEMCFAGYRGMWNVVLPRHDQD